MTQRVNSKRSSVWLAGLAAILGLVSTSVQAQPDYPHVRYNATCYAAPNDNYDNLIQSWVDRNQQSNGLDRAYFERQFSEETFSAMRNALDCRWMIYRHGTQNIGAFMLKPHAHEGALPVIVYHRPGQGPRGRVSFRQLAEQLAPLAQAGYIVIGSQYPGGGGVHGGLQNGVDEFAGADLEALREIYDIIDAEPMADSSQIVLYGKGRGALMALLSLADHQPEGVRAVVTESALTDVSQWFEERPLNQTQVQAYTTDPSGRSAQARVGDIPQGIAFKMIHGGQDREVGLAQTEKMQRDLEAQGVNVDSLIFPRGDHNLTRERSRIQQEIITWLADTL